MSFRVGSGEILTLLGRNGSGRTTTAKAIMGLVKSEGEIIFKNRNLLNLETHEISLLGVGYVPECRDVFPNLSVRQNLYLGNKKNKSQFSLSLERSLELFPILKKLIDKPAGLLSGGEQQILSLSRALMGDPELLVIDEPTEGLAPKLVELVAGTLFNLKSNGVSILLIEQKLTIALEVSDRCLVMEHGRIVFDDTPKILRGNQSVYLKWLGV